MAIRDTEARYLFLGLLLAFYGGLMNFYIFAIATMVDPSLVGRAWWAEVFIHIGTGGGWPIFGLGVLMVVSGFSLVVWGFGVALWKSLKFPRGVDTLDA